MKKSLLVWKWIWKIIDIKTFDDLQVYCYRVAGVIGILVATILGFEDPKTKEYASKLGTTFQLINIIRDIGEDAKRNRLYIPLEDLNQFSISPIEILTKKIKSQEKFKSLMKFQANRARKYYNEAIQTLPMVDRHKQQSGLIMAEIYLNLLKKIEENNFNVLNHHYTISTINKLWITWKTVQSEKKKIKEQIPA